jgi:hypothetical protein
VAGYALLLLAALAKENFIVLIPAAMGLSIAATGLRRMARRDWLTMAAVAALTAADLAAMAWKVGAYGTIYPQVRTPQSIIDQLLLILRTENQYAWIFAGALVTLILMLQIPSGLSRAALTGMAVGVFLLLPQAFFMAGAVPQGRYLYPVVLVGCFVWAMAFWAARNLPAARASTTAVLLVALAVPLSNGFTLSRDKGRENKVTTARFQDQLAGIVRETRETDTKIVVVQPLQPELDLEPVAAFATYLTKSHGLTVMTVPAPRQEGASDYSRALNAMLSKWSTEGNEFMSAYRRMPCLSVLLGDTVPVCKDSIRLE